MYLKNGPDRIHQGDIIENFEYKVFEYQDDKISMKSFTFPYVIILSQECDLEQDYRARSNYSNPNNQCNNDKFIDSLLVCPGYLAEELRNGEHLKDLGYTMEHKNKDQWGNIKLNQNDRFHFLEQDLEKGLPNIVIDFKHYYTITRKDIYQVFKTNYKISLKELFRERLSQRFANYLSRIGLPEQETIQQPSLQTPTT